MPLKPHEFWQELYPPGFFACKAQTRHDTLYPAVLPDGCQIALPIRPLPGKSRLAVASLIVNQASFVVEEALAGHMIDAIRPFKPEIVVGVPTLGLPLAHAVARGLGHSRMVALGTSRKFWYDDALSEPLASITSPGHTRNLYLDPRLLPLLQGRRVAVVDDAISTGRSTAAVVKLLGKAGTRPVVLAYAMLQTARWQAELETLEAGLCRRVRGAFETPLLEAVGDGGWRALDTASEARALSSDPHNE
ncbi:phosphoribosyltransferase [Nitratireductor alexandrii]|uniref:phosphoribosyltransferase n=1 Tax=Nitratireductor alexandrii TaxID=2448161 RepID=UPI000FD9F694|nr:phosphoribosyltransferase [Nitratireductor alexandrii]